MLTRPSCIRSCSTGKGRAKSNATTLDLQNKTKGFGYCNICAACYNRDISFSSLLLSQGLGIAGSLRRFNRSFSGIRPRDVDVMNNTDFSDATILVVDDDVAVATMLDELLLDEGYQVYLARTLADARQQLDDHVPDVLLLDVQLPDGSGFDYCVELRGDSKTADVPILFLSGIDRDPDSVARGLDLGGYDFLRKPFRNVELLARVRVMVRLRKLQQRLIEQERERAMLATAGAAAHSLAQPLMGALGLTSMVLKGELSEAQRHDLELIYGALKQMSATVHQIQEVQHFITQPYLEDAPDLHILDIEQASANRRPE